MLGNRPPYTTMQQLNLDWVLSKLKTLLRLVPDDGAVGQILRRTRDGAVWSDEQGGGGGGAVQSVNGKTGAVVLDADDVGALPDDYTPPVTSVNGQTGAVSFPYVSGIRVDNQGGGGVTQHTGVVSLVGLGCQVLTEYFGRIRVEVSKGSIGLGLVANERQYSANNPPPYPVTSVNGQTGAVVIPTSSTTVYHKKITGTTTSSGSLVTGLKREDYIIIGAAVNRQTSGYYTSSYNLLPSGADSSGNLIIAAVVPTSSGTTTLGNTAIAVDIYYIENTAVEE